MFDEVCGNQLTIPSFNTEFAADEHYTCGERAAALVIIEHSGDNCGDNGVCLFDTVTGEKVEPWTEKRYLCAECLADFENENKVNGELPPAVKITQK